MFNRVRHVGALIWRDAGALGLILNLVTSAAAGFGAATSYRIGAYRLAMMDSMLSGVLLGYAIFTATHLWRRQLEREHFENWARGTVQKLTQEANEVIAAQMEANSGGENAGQRIH